MQVSKWGNRLAIRLPSEVVEALNLKEGDQIEIGLPARGNLECAAILPGSGRWTVCGVCVVLYRRDLYSTGKRPMPAKDFFDTNVLIYAVGKDDPRASQAEALLAGGGIMGLQSLTSLCGGATQAGDVVERSKRDAGYCLRSVPRTGSDLARYPPRRCGHCREVRLQYLRFADSLGRPGGWL